MLSFTPQNVDSVTYRRDMDEAEAMVTRILRKAPHPTPAASAQPLNAPGAWDFFLSHGQAAAGDQVKMLCFLLRQRGKKVWYDNEMANRSTAAMEEGVKHSAHFLIFLSGDPDLSLALAPPPEGVPPEPEPEPVPDPEPQSPVPTVMAWDAAALAAWATNALQLPKVGETIVEAGVDGATALEMLREDWKELGASGLQCAKIMGGLKKLAL